MTLLEDHRKIGLGLLCLSSVLIQALQAIHVTGLQIFHRSESSGDCIFDDDSKPFCDWEQDKTDTQLNYPNWMRGVSTPSDYTGPVGDHTTGRGKFAYAEASGCSNNAGTTVRLQSVQFPTTGGRCMSFWYYALGEQVGQLNVYVRDVGNAQMTKQSGISGDQGAEWKQMKVHFSHASAYKIVLEMVCGGGYNGDIAVDDIKFNDGACAA